MAASTTTASTSTSKPASQSNQSVGGGGGGGRTSAPSAPVSASAKPTSIGPAIPGYTPPAYTKPVVTPSKPVPTPQQGIIGGGGYKGPSAPSAPTSSAPTLKPTMMPAAATTPKLNTPLNMPVKPAPIGGAAGSFQTPTIVGGNVSVGGALYSGSAVVPGSGGRTASQIIQDLPYFGGIGYNWRTQSGITAATTPTVPVPASAKVTPETIMARGPMVITRLPADEIYAQLEASRLKQLSTPPPGGGFTWQGFLQSPFAKGMDTLSAREIKILQTVGETFGGKPVYIPAAKPTPMPISQGKDTVYSRIYPAASEAYRFVTSGFGGTPVSIPTTKPTPMPMTTEPSQAYRFITSGFGGTPVTVPAAKPVPMPMTTEPSQAYRFITSGLGGTPVTIPVAKPVPMPIRTEPSGAVRFITSGFGGTPVSIPAARPIPMPISTEQSQAYRFIERTPAYRFITSGFGGTPVSIPAARPTPMPISIEPSQAYRFITSGFGGTPISIVPGKLEPSKIQEGKPTVYSEFINPEILSGRLFTRLPEAAGETAAKETIEKYPQGKIIPSSTITGKLNILTGQYEPRGVVTIPKEYLAEYARKAAYATVGAGEVVGATALSGDLLIGAGVAAPFFKPLAEKVPESSLWKPLANLATSPGTYFGAAALKLVGAGIGADIAKSAGTLSTGSKIVSTFGGLVPSTSKSALAFMTGPGTFPVYSSYAEKYIPEPGAGTFYPALSFLRGAAVYGAPFAVSPTFAEAGAGALASSLIRQPKETIAGIGEYIKTKPFEFAGAVVGPSVIARAIGEGGMFLGKTPASVKMPSEFPERIAGNRATLILKDEFGNYFKDESGNPYVVYVRDKVTKQIMSPGGGIEDAAGKPIAKPNIFEIFKSGSKELKEELGLGKNDVVSLNKIDKWDTPRETYNVVEVRLKKGAINKIKTGSDVTEIVKVPLSKGGDFTGGTPRFPFEKPTPAGRVTSILGLPQVSNIQVGIRAEDAYLLNRMQAIDKINNQIKDLRMDQTAFEQMKQTAKNWYQKEFSDVYKASKEYKPAEESMLKDYLLSKENMLQTVPEYAFGKTGKIKWIWGPTSRYRTPAEVQRLVTDLNKLERKYTKYVETKIPFGKEPIKMGQAPFEQTLPPFKLTTKEIRTVEDAKQIITHAAPSPIPPKNLNELITRTREVLSGKTVRGSVSGMHVSPPTWPFGPGYVAASYLGIGPEAGPISFGYGATLRQPTVYVMREKISGKLFETAATKEDVARAYQTPGRKLPTWKGLQGGEAENAITGGSILKLQGKPEVLYMMGQRILAQKARVVKVSPEVEARVSRAYDKLRSGTSSERLVAAKQLKADTGIDYSSEISSRVVSAPIVYTPLKLPVVSDKIKLTNEEAGKVSSVLSLPKEIPRETKAEEYKPGNELRIRVIQEVPREIPREVSRETPKEVTREVPRETPEVPREPQKEKPGGEVSKEKTGKESGGRESQKESYTPPKETYVPREIMKVVPMQPSKKEREARKKRYERAYQLSVRKEGKYVKVGAPEAKGAALRRGAAIAVEHAIATFKVEPTKGLALSSAAPFKPSPLIFRGYKVSKGKILPLKDTFIQKQPKRIISGGEVREISLKGARISAEARKARAIGLSVPFSKRVKSRQKKVGLI